MKFSILIGVVSSVSVVLAGPVRHPHKGMRNGQMVEEWKSLTSALGTGWRSALAAQRSSFLHKIHPSTTSVAMTSSAASDSTTPTPSAKAMPSETSSLVASSSSAATSSPDKVASSFASASTSSSTPTPTPDNTNTGSTASPITNPLTSAAVLGPTAEQFAYLTPHNDIRAQKGAVALTWNNTLETYAQQWANQCIFQHSDSPNGENVAAGTGSFTPAAGIALWISEESSYNPMAPLPSHYTQVVWKDTTQLGCAVAVCNDLLGADTGDANYFVCEYYPPGNVINHFVANVEA